MPFLCTDDASDVIPIETSAIKSLLYATGVIPNLSYKGYDNCMLMTFFFGWLHGCYIELLKFVVAIFKGVSQNWCI